MNKKEDRTLDRNHVDHICNIIRLTANNEEDIEILYHSYLKKYDYLNKYQRKYFKNKIFKEVPYEETASKMKTLMKTSISEVTFCGKELDNIQRFLREYKLNKLK